MDPRASTAGHPAGFSAGTAWRWPLPSVHTGRARTPDGAEWGGPRRSHLPRPACPLGPTLQPCGVLRPLCSPSFCLLSHSQLLHSAHPGQPAPQPRPRGPLEGQRSKAGPHVPSLIGPSQDPAPPGSATEKGEAPVPGLPEAPHTKGRRQRHFLGWQVLVSDSAQSTGAGVRRGRVSRVGGQHRHVGRAPQWRWWGGRNRWGHLRAMSATEEGRRVPEEQGG